MVTLQDYTQEEDHALTKLQLNSLLINFNSRLRSSVYLSGSCMVSYRDGLVLKELVNYQSKSTIIHTELLQAITPLKQSITSTCNICMRPTTYPPPLKNVVTLQVRTM